ncbi:MAG: hypothetical protein V1837_03380 [Candidatus Woesearchaeota archaeon]
MAEERKFRWELISNFALVYSIVIAILIVPYAYIRGLLSGFVLLFFAVYLIAIVVYIYLWARDKWSFVKYEIEGK